MGVLRRTKGGGSTSSADDDIEGVPELVVEIAASGVAYDFYDQRRAYQRNGVLEYWAWGTDGPAVTWFCLRSGLYEPLPDQAGILCSEQFPGLWLEVPTLSQGDDGPVLATLQRGIAEAKGTGQLYPWEDCQDFLNSDLGRDGIVSYNTSTHKLR